MFNIFVCQCIHLTSTLHIINCKDKDINNYKDLNLEETCYGHDQIISRGENLP